MGVGDHALRTPRHGERPRADRDRVRFHDHDPGERSRDGHLGVCDLHRADVVHTDPEPCRRQRDSHVRYIPKAIAPPGSTSSGYVGIDPKRVYDSRLDMTPDANGPVAGGATAPSAWRQAAIATGAVDVTDIVPTNAVAVTATLTVTGTVGTGYLAEPGRCLHRLRLDDQLDVAGFRPRQHHVGEPRPEPHPDRRRRGRVDPLRDRRGRLLRALTGIRRTPRLGRRLAGAAFFAAEAFFGVAFFAFARSGWWRTDGWPGPPWRRAGWPRAPTARSMTVAFAAGASSNTGVLPGCLLLDDPPRPRVRYSSRYSPGWKSSLSASTSDFAIISSLSEMSTSSSASKPSTAGDIDELVGEHERGQREVRAVGADRGQVLLLAHHEAADADPTRTRHRRGEQRVRLGRLVRDDEVRGVEHQRVDIVGGHERLQPDLLGLRGRQRGEIVVGDDDVVLRAHVVALDDVLGGHFLARGLADLAVADARHGLVVELVERDALLLDRRQSRIGMETIPNEIEPVHTGRAMRREYPFRAPASPVPPPRAPETGRRRLRAGAARRGSSTGPRASSGSSSSSHSDRHRHGRPGGRAQAVRRDEGLVDRRSGCSRDEPDRARSLLCHFQLTSSRHRPVRRCATAPPRTPTSRGTCSPERDRDPDLDAALAGHLRAGDEVELLHRDAEQAGDGERLVPRGARSRDRCRRARTTAGPATAAVEVHGWISIPAKLAAHTSAGAPSTSRYSRVSSVLGTRIRPAPHPRRARARARPCARTPSWRRRCRRGSGCRFTGRPARYGVIHGAICA